MDGVIWKTNVGHGRVLGSGIHEEWVYFVRGGLECGFVEFKLHSGYSRDVQTLICCCGSHEGDANVGWVNAKW